MGISFSLPLMAWAVIDRKTGQVAIWNSQVPVFWLRKVAVHAALDRGFTTRGKSSQVIIRKVKISGR